ncbi:hypothetical protein [Streptomyces sp. NBC_00443]|uniref:hypothetical protein n=1 Tax=Streptomyces sp. NBC_00443 TaxID=2975743 RepID=UPI002E24BB43
MTATTATPEPGTTRYLCPLECGWHHDVPPPALADMNGILPDPDAREWPEYVTSVVRQASLRRMNQTEQALSEHLTTHTTEQFVRVIHDLRVEMAQLKGAGEALAREAVERPVR